MLTKEDKIEELQTNRCIENRRVYMAVKGSLRKVKELIERET